MKTVYFKHPKAISETYYPAKEDGKMNNLEASKILAVLGAAYTRSISESDAIALVKLWANIFSEIPYSDVGEAVMRFIKSDTKGFMPLPGQIMEIVESRRIEAEGRLIEQRFAYMLEQSAEAMLPESVTDAKMSESGMLLGEHTKIKGGDSNECRDQRA